LHLEFFVQSSNQSPEANNQLITKSSQNIFTSFWDNSSIGEDNSLIENNEQIDKQKRILMLAIVGLFGALVGAMLVAKKFLWRDFNEVVFDKNEKLLHPIEDDRD
jgi:hypothetical protein